MPIRATMSVLDVRLDRVTKRYDSGTAVDGVSMTVPSRAFVSLVGPAGSGKTTLLKLIAGRETPTAGSIRISEQDVTAVEAAARPVAFIAPTDLADSSRPVTADGAVVLVDDLSTDLQLSDPSARRAMLGALHGQAGRTLVYATSEPDDALSVSDCIAVLRDGKVQQFGTPTEIYDMPANEFVAELFGRPPINLVPAILEKDGQAILIGNQTISLAGRIAEEFCRDITVGVRPAHVQLHRDGIGWRGRVVSTERCDDRALVTVEVEGIRVRALDATAAALGPGEAVSVRILPKHYIVFDDRGVRLDQI